MNDCTCPICRRELAINHVRPAGAPVLNVELGWKVRDLIVANPKHHNQSMWFNDSSLTGPTGSPDRQVPLGLADVLNRCGTTACAAGWTLLAADYKLNDRGDVFRPDGTEAFGVSSEAQRLLGLTSSEAALLFHGLDDDQVPELMEKLFGPRPEVTS